MTSINLDDLVPNALPGPRYAEVVDKVDDPTTVVAFRLPISGKVPDIIVAVSLPMSHAAIARTVILDDVPLGVV